MTHEDLHFKQEIAAQKWRRLTPATAIANILTTVASSGALLALIAYFGNHYIESSDKKFDVLFKQMNEDRDGTSKQFQCLTKEVFQCCGQKANANC